jgi:hypothetical protein
MPYLTREERAQVVMLSGGRTLSEVTNEFNRLHPERSPITRGCVCKLLAKFRATSSIDDRPRSGTPVRATSSEISALVASYVSTSPQLSLSLLALRAGVSKTSVHRILKREKYHPYKPHVLHRSFPNDSEKRLRFCRWAIHEFEENPEFPYSILFTDEAVFSAGSGSINRQNSRYWAQENPHWVLPVREQGGPRMMVWCGIWRDRVIGPYFINSSVTGDRYLRLLRDEVFNDMSGADIEFPLWFQHDGASAHYSLQVREFLDQVRTLDRARWICWMAGKKP